MSSKIQIVGEIYTRNGLEYPVLDESDVTGGYKSVADENKQRSLSLIYPSMSAPQIIEYDTYQTWHTDVLSVYFTTKTSIEACTTRTELDAIVFDTEFATEISGKPDISLSDFV